MQAPEFSAAAMRNSEPILGVLRTELDDCHSVFEIGSGTAQHATYFCTAMPQLDWQTSDIAEYHDVIRTRLAEADLPNVREPLLVDLEAPPAIDSGYDAVFSCNTMHIMNMAAVRNLLPFVARLLRPGGLFCYYGAFRRCGGYTTDSNAEFDRSLQAREPHMGLRDFEDIGVLATTAGLQHERTYAMPANNLLVIWSRRCNASE
jgi:SAM-dependent methyltransferase